MGGSTYPGIFSKDGSVVEKDVYVAEAGHVH
jgi:hypothetical protein